MKKLREDIWFSLSIHIQKRHWERPAPEAWCRFLQNGRKHDRRDAHGSVRELLDEKINALDDTGLEQDLRIHFSIRERPELLGIDNHLMILEED